MHRNDSVIIDYFFIYPPKTYAINNHYFAHGNFSATILLSELTMTAVGYP